MTGDKPLSVCEIFFNDLYKYIKKDYSPILLNKKMVFEPNSTIEKHRIIDKKIIYDAKYNIDEYGYRMCECNKNAKDTYVFSGCSFMFGVGLNDNETLPYYFSKRLNFNSNIINIGYPGGGLHTTLVDIKSNNFINATKEKEIKYLFFEFLQEHIFRAFIGRFQDNIFRLKNNKLELKDKNIFLRSILFDRMILFNSNFTYMINKIYHDEETGLFLSLFEELNNIVKNDYNAKLVVFTFDASKESDTLFNELNKKGIETVKINFDYGSKKEGYYKIIGDGHPTANANKEAAEILFSYINKKD